MHEKICGNCKYHTVYPHKYPCSECIGIRDHPNWKPKETESCFWSFNEERDDPPIGGKPEDYMQKECTNCKYGHEYIANDDKTACMNRAKSCRYIDGLRLVWEFTDKPCETCKHSFRNEVNGKECKKSFKMTPERECWEPTKTEKDKINDLCINCAFLGCDVSGPTIMYKCKNHDWNLFSTFNFCSDHEYLTRYSRLKYIQYLAQQIYKYQEEDPCHYMKNELIYQLQGYLKIAPKYTVGNKEVFDKLKNQVAKMVMFLKLYEKKDEPNPDENIILIDDILKLLHEEIMDGEKKNFKFKEYSELERQFNKEEEQKLLKCSDCMYYSGKLCLNNNGCEHETRLNPYLNEEWFAPYCPFYDIKSKKISEDIIDIQKKMDEGIEIYHEMLKEKLNQIRCKEGIIKLASEFINKKKEGEIMPENEKNIKEEIMELEKNIQKEKQSRENFFKKIWELRYSIMNDKDKYYCLTPEFLDYCNFPKKIKKLIKNLRFYRSDFSNLRKVLLNGKDLYTGEIKWNEWEQIKSCLEQLPEKYDEFKKRELTREYCQLTRDCMKPAKKNTCPTCGKKNRKDAVFCCQCGKILKPITDYTPIGD